MLISSSAQKVGNGFEVQFQADLASPQQFINCYVACDDLAGTQRMATLKPAIASGLFPKITDMEEDRPVLSRVSPYPTIEPRGRAREQSADFDDELDDADLAAVAAGDDEFEDIDDVVEEVPALAGSGKSRKSATQAGRSNDKDTNTTAIDFVPKRLPNGNWECKHTCADKTSCRHPCCQNGSEAKPKPPKPKKTKQADDSAADTSNSKDTSSKSTKTKKPLVVVHTDPFSASKKSSSTSTKQSKQSKPPPAKRPRSNDTDFGGDDIDFDDIIADVPALTLDRFSGLSTFRPINGVEGSVAKSEGLFVTSSPKKAVQKWDEVDLSSEHDRPAMMARPEKRPRTIPAPQQPVRKARSASTTTQMLNREPKQKDEQRLVALSDLEYGETASLPRTTSTTSHRPPSRHGPASKPSYNLNQTTDMNINTAPIVQAAFTATGVTFRADATTATADEDNDFPDMDIELEDDQMQLHMLTPLQKKPQYGIRMNNSLSPSTSFDAATIHDFTTNVKRVDEDDENTMLPPETFDEVENAAEVGLVQGNDTHDSDGDYVSAVPVKEEQEKVVLKEEEKEDPEFTQWMAGMEEFVEIV